MNKYELELHKAVSAKRKSRTSGGQQMEGRKERPTEVLSSLLAGGCEDVPVDIDLYRLVSRRS